MISPTDYCVLLELDDRWEWIARDESQQMYAYEYRPIKSRLRGQWEPSQDDYYPLIHDCLQFVQWEDKNPFNIAELIEEYEREETEVKKDIEWAIKEIEGLETEPSQNYPHDEMIEREIVLGILRQLDELGVLSQEWIDEYAQGDYDEWVYTEDLQNSLVPKQELSEIPQFVSNWIEETKKQRKTLVFAIAHIYDKNEIDESPSKEEKRIFQWMELDDNDEVFARAWLDGYTIKKEPKYNVRLRVKSSFGTVGIFLYKQGDEVLAGDNFKAYYPKEDEFRLTEQEIRDFQNGDVLFEHFAVKVEGLEE